MPRGLYAPGCYMGSCADEYWAEGAQSWFDATVRRDVNMLSDANLVRRRHGGVEYAGEPGMNLSYDSRQVTNIAAKHAISLHVASLIPDGASILIGIGSTLELVALNLVDHRHRGHQRPLLHIQSPNSRAASRNE